MAVLQCPPKEVHNKERKLTETLLNVAENQNESEQLLEVLTSDHIKKVSPWELTIYHPRFAVPKRKKGSQTISLNEQSGNESGLAPVRFNTKTRLEMFTSTWRTAVEPAYYHYVSNNGMYRASKCFNQFNLSLKKSSPLDKITPEQNRIQREIQQHLQEASVQKTDLIVEKNPHDVHQEEPTMQEEKSSGVIDDFVPLEVEEVPFSDNIKVRRPVKSPFELPPIRVPLVNNVKNRDNYFSTRLIIMEEELNRDTALRHVLSSPDISTRAARSRSEPPKNVNSTSQKRIRSGSKQAKNSVKDQCQSDTELREIAAKYSTSVTSKQEGYSKDDLDVVHVRPLSTKTANADKTGSRQSRVDQVNSKNDRISGDKAEDKINKALTHHVRFTTASGEVVNIPKFGQYAGETSGDRIDGKSDKVCAEEKQMQRVDSAGNREDGIGHDLHGVLHTTHYVTSDFYSKCSADKISSLQSQFLRNAADIGAQRAVNNGFHSVAVGKSRHREKLDSSMLTKAQEATLPEIAGRSLVSVQSVAGKYI